MDAGILLPLLDLENVNLDFESGRNNPNRQNLDAMAHMSDIDDSTQYVQVEVANLVYSE